jgi:hypothetical protein
MNISADVFYLITECTQLYKNMLISKLFLEGSCKFVIRYDVLMSGVNDNHIIYNIYIYEKKFCTFYYVAGTFSPSSTVHEELGFCKYFCASFLLPCVSSQVLMKLSSSILLKDPVTCVCCMCPVKLIEMAQMKPDQFC